MTKYLQYFFTLTNYFDTIDHNFLIIIYIFYKYGIGEHTLNLIIKLYLYKRKSIRFNDKLPSPINVYDVGLLQ